MPQAQLQLCLGAMQRLALEAPENARAFLQDNPQLCYALLHAQLLLGLTLEPGLPPSAEEAQQLRAEAARRPAVSLAPGAGVVVPPGAPGMPGGPPRPLASGAPLHGALRAGVPGLLGVPLPPGLLPAALPVVRPLGLAPAPPPLALGARAFPGPADIGLAPKGWPLRPPSPAPQPSLVPGLAPKACVGAAGPMAMG
mmetsp:Transcript_86461/g.269040  ORF Transcript_86461/g.269040 Transcript_86461/m.269040 type:complete len:197 (-) Transcript_86461:107-697(-)